MNNWPKMALGDPYKVLQLVFAYKCKITYRVDLTIACLSENEENCGHQAKCENETDMKH